MVFDHDYKKYPELTNQQIEEFGLTSPHVQYTEDFEATVIKVTDGDTITLETKDRDFTFPLRIAKIDAPEMNAGGEEAKEWLKEQIEGENVEIKINKNNRVGRYGRLIGEVFYNGLDMGESELRLGLAVPFGLKNEGQPEDINKILNIRQWL